MEVLRTTLFENRRCVVAVIVCGCDAAGYRTVLGRLREEIRRNNQPTNHRAFYGLNSDTRFIAVIHDVRFR